MESSDVVALDLLLSPPYLTWFSRDECPLPALVWGEGSPLAWLPAGLWSRAALTAAAAAATCAGAALLLWRLRFRDRESVVEDKELKVREEVSELTHGPIDWLGNSDSLAKSESARGLVSETMAVYVH